MNIGPYFRYIVHTRVELSSQIPTSCSDSRIVAWEHASKSRTGSSPRWPIDQDATGDCLEKSFEHTHFPDTTLHIHRSQGASARKIRRQRYHAPRPQIPPVRLGNEILVGTFGITFTSSLSFKSVYQKYPPIVRFIFCGTPHDQVIDRAYRNKVRHSYMSFTGASYVPR